MIKVLIVDDDDAVRAKTLRCLARADVQLTSAANGRMGLDKARVIRPDIVICDVDMPEMNGFEVLEALRDDESLKSTQVMMLTAQGSRDSMRLGMTLGADDYLVKPFTDEELVQAFESLLKKRGRLADVVDTAVDTAVKSQEEQLLRAFGSRLEGDASGPLIEPREATAAQGGREATVLFTDIRGFTSIAEKLTAAEVAALLAEYFERSCEPVLAAGGQHLKMMGDGLMAVFTDTADTPPAARRALQASLILVSVAQRFAAWVDTTFVDRGLPPFRIGIGVHSGEVAISYLGSAADKIATPIGDTVNTAARLESASKELGWAIVASTETVNRAGPGVRVGATAPLQLRGKAAALDVSEVVSMEDPTGAPVDQRAHFEPTLFFTQGYEATLSGPADKAVPAMSVTQRVRIEAAENARMAARAVKGALGEKLASFENHSFTGNEALRLHGYRILQRIGRGGMSSIYLSRREADGELVVLKILNADREASDQMARFAREYNLLSRIQHPHVIRIFNQGFSDQHAYIAMEYFENGDLRARMSGPIAPFVALGIAMQIASALGAIHNLGIVHRDLKPENLMVRADGSVVLADFGIAKSVTNAAKAELSLTLHGDLMGSPSYMSPEQAAGREITTASDLYSLGVIFFELLTGQRPYTGETVLATLALHANAPPPKLPDALAPFQPLINELMAKKPEARPISATAVVRAMETHADIIRRDIMAGPGS